MVANSAFTQGVVQHVWPDLGRRERGVGIVYPCVDAENWDGGLLDEGHEEELWKGKRVLLSINRFESKKNVCLAIKAFAGLQPPDREGVRLVIAGKSS